MDRFANSSSIFARVCRRFRLSISIRYFASFYVLLNCFASCFLLNFCAFLFLLPPFLIRKAYAFLLRKDGCSHVEVDGMELEVQNHI